MSVRTIEQVVFHGNRPVGQSPGLDDASVDAIRALVESFGPLPDGMRALFVARPGGRLVSVVRINGSFFHVLAVPDRLYRNFHDPFLIDRKFPADFSARGTLDTLHWEGGRPPERTVADVKAVLQHGDGPTLLGAAQALIEGGRVAFRSDLPNQIRVEEIWALLPDADRGELTVATFAPRNALAFRLVVAPRVDTAEFKGYLTEEQAGDYPEGRYELALQHAAETDDAARIQDLFARRSGSQSLRMAIGMLAAALSAGLALKFIPWEKLR